MVDDGAVRCRHFRWHSMLVMMCEQMHCPVETAYCDNISGLLCFSAARHFPVRSGSSNSAAMFKTVNPYNSFRIPEYSSHYFAGWHYHVKLSGRWSSDMFPGHTLHFTSGSKWWSQVSSTVTNLEIKLSGFSLNQLTRMAGVSVWSAFWTSDNVRHVMQRLFINLFSCQNRLKCQ